MCDAPARFNQAEATKSDDLAIGITDFVDELVVALVNSRIYLADHPRVLAAIQRALGLLRELTGQAGTGSLIISAVDGYLVYEGHPMLGASVSASRLIKPLADRGSGGLEFGVDATEEEMKTLVEVLIRAHGKSETYKETNEHLASRGCERIGLLPPYRYGAKATRGQAGGSEGGSGVLIGGNAHDVRVSVQLYQRVVDCLQTAAINVSQGGRIDFDDVRAIAEQLIKGISFNARDLLSMARYERYDAYTFGHSMRVGSLALNFARHLTDDEELLNRVGVAALLHDVGKSRVPFDVLHHQGPLSAEQRSEMEKHPEFGAEILLDHEGVDDMAVVVAYGHHRTEDGQGYPKDELQARLSTITRIAKVCDVYEALTAVRPYKPAMSPVRAYRIMFSMKGHFDTAILRRFIEVNGIYPVGSRVRMEDGVVAQVFKQTSELTRPIVELAEDAAGNELFAEDRHAIDLSQPEHMGLRVQELLKDEVLQPL